jgi:hypothetical protein
VGDRRHVRRHAAHWAVLGQESLRFKRVKQKIVKLHGKPNQHPGRFTIQNQRVSPKTSGNFRLIRGSVVPTSPTRATIATRRLTSISASIGSNGALAIRGAGPRSTIGENQSPGTGARNKPVSGRASSAPRLPTYSTTRSTQPGATTSGSLFATRLFCTGCYSPSASAMPQGCCRRTGKAAHSLTLG